MSRLKSRENLPRTRMIKPQHQILQRLKMIRWMALKRQRMQTMTTTMVSSTRKMEKKLKSRQRRRSQNRKQRNPRSKKTRQRHRRQGRKRMFTSQMAEGAKNRTSNNEVTAEMIRTPTVQATAMYKNRSARENAAAKMWTRDEVVVRDIVVEAEALEVLVEAIVLEAAQEVEVKPIARLLLFRP
jgi:hypothetical protein